MKCVGCGAELEPGALLCPSCGRVVSSEDVAKSKARSGQLTKKEFYKLPGMKSCRGNIRGCAIILYFCSGMTILASVLMQVLTSSSVMDGFQISASIIDGVLLLALGLWLQFGKSRICAIITLCYGIFNMVGCNRERPGAGLADSPGRRVGDCLYVQVPQPVEEIRKER